MTGINLNVAGDVVVFLMKQGSVFHTLAALM